MRDGQRLPHHADGIKAEREGLATKPAAIDAHAEVGRQVRRAIERIGGTMPERLPVEPHIKQGERRLAAAAPVKRITDDREPGSEAEGS